MDKIQILLFYLIIILFLISGFETRLSETIIYLTILLILASIFISIKYNSLYTLSDRTVGNYRVKNIESIYALIIFCIGFCSLHFELKNKDLVKDFLNYYYLLSLPIYFLFLIRIKKTENKNL